jgi:hypothetical protein
MRRLVPRFAKLAAPKILWHAVAEFQEEADLGTPRASFRKSG